MRKAFHRLFFLSSVIPRLQIEPVALGDTEVMRQPVRDVGVDGALALHDIEDTPHRNVDVTSKMPDAHASRSEEFFQQYSAGVDLLLPCVFMGAPYFLVPIVPVVPTLRVFQSF